MHPVAAFAPAPFLLGLSCSSSITWSEYPGSSGCSAFAPRTCQRSAYHCTYSKMWIRTKYAWGLKLQSAEKSALQSMLNTC